MVSRWIPWKYLVKQAAHAYGIIDPLTLLARLRRFAQPSEIQEPIDLLRAGIVFHARGLINTKAIQHNLDWIWPYWISRQFNPNDRSFIPRAYSLTHVNLTHRNWTALGQPGFSVYPIVDPRGLVTPLYDGWSLDFWLYSTDGKGLFPSRAPHAEQYWEFTPDPVLITETEAGEQRIVTAAVVQIEEKAPYLQVKVEGHSTRGGWMVIALRPYNPEGIQFIEKVEFDRVLDAWRINSDVQIRLDKPPERVLFSNYNEGDVAFKLDEPEVEHAVRCPVGMATAAALFSVGKHCKEKVHIKIPLQDNLPLETSNLSRPDESWSSVLGGAARLEVSDEKIQFLYEAALRTLILLSAGDVFPGPYTYKRFWFRDACYMINALLASGLSHRAERLLERFFPRQKRSGYFQSQEGEWDSNGQVLWIIDRLNRLVNRPLNRKWLDGVVRGGEWIKRKRLQSKKGKRHDGLLPAGFSAEHLGPNDYYYWDNFWSVAGLRGAARLVKDLGLDLKEAMFLRESLDLEKHIFQSIASIPDQKARGAIPASPYRRLDAGAVGSLVADYPLQLTPRRYSRIDNTVRFLLENCFHSGAFFQAMIHSGVNVYLTLCIAQTLLRSGDERYRALIEAAASLASPTGQWPEAIHPRTRGGCMGDGQHGWAAAEWVMMIRNLFVREEGERLILGSGIFPRWLKNGRSASFGPTLTPFGSVSVALFREPSRVFLNIDAVWHNNSPPPLEIQVPGFKSEHVTDPQDTYQLTPLG